MSHLDLTTTSQSVSGYDARRTLSMVTTDQNTVVHVLAADGAGVTDATACAFVAELTGQKKSVPITDGSTYLLYALKQGTSPSAIWVDAATPLASAPSSASSQGTVQLSVAPAAAATPIALGSNDVRVTTIEHVASFSGTDGSLTEEPIPSPGVASTITAVTFEGSATVTQSDTDYDTITLAKRDGAGGSAVSICAPTTKTTGGIALLAFREVAGVVITAASANSLLAGDKLTLKSAKSGNGQAIGRMKVRITYTVP